MKSKMKSKMKSTLNLVLHRVALVASAVLLVAAIGTRPALAAATPWPDPPDPIKQDDQKVHKKKSKKPDKNQDKSDAIGQPERALAQAQFMQGYHAAYELIMAGNYEAGIVALHALGRDEHPDVANYIGYANRRLGRYDESKVWYEKALAADPNHVRTWSYYGMWQMEQGNRLKAEDDLQKVRLLCGTTDCTEYKQLKDVIDGKATY
ncbi:MAG TPA: tetratricopeptide repeat protein [Pseudolabrys sp.]|nr:tetratricopeptide repeat protein [Pseudolabrys sp.]